MARKIFGLIALLAVAFNGSGQTTRYSIDITARQAEIKTGQLRMGGSNPSGERIDVNSLYISRGGKPIIPITGEFHFSRYPRAYWDESIKKMKAGGINTVATYVFWNIHEEHEGQFDWTDNRDVRYFVQLCQENGMNVVMRIGPFCHGEIRNGGLPEWLLGKPVAIRSNDPGYLGYVEKLYNQIGKQLKGLYYKDGGPIIAVQLENELQHSASPWGLTYPGQPYDLTVADRDLASAHEGVSVSSGKNEYAEEGNEHMRKLKALAQQAGIDPPLFTATGWGYAAGIPNETLPVTAAYAYPTWTEKKALSPFYVYKDMHKDPDYAPVRYNPEDYPVFPAELGSGIMTTYSRRPIVPAASLDALINRCLGSGANGIGYYMYHGGSTPKGDFYFNDEAYAYPKISYDFQAPIGEYGDIRPSFQRLKLLHYFINDFADILAPMQTILPENNASIKPDDIRDLRYAVRTKDGSGFLFLNNFQDDTIMTEQKNIQVSIKTANGDIRIPGNHGFDLPGGENLILPFHLDLNGALLNYATAQLLAKGEDENGSFIVFFVPAGIQPEFSFAKTVQVERGESIKIDHDGQNTLVTCPGAEASSFSIKGSQGKRTRVLVISKQMALKAYKVTINGGAHLIFSDAVILEGREGLPLYADSNNSFTISIYPSLKKELHLNAGSIQPEKGTRLFSTYLISLPPAKLSVSWREEDKKHLVVQLPQGLPQNINDAFLTIDYTGDTGMGFLGGELVTDEFYKGMPWKIGLKRFIKKYAGANISPDPDARQMLFYFRPIYEGAPYLVDFAPSLIPDFSKNSKVATINNVSILPEYTTTLSFDK